MYRLLLSVGLVLVSQLTLVGGASAAPLAGSSSVIAARHPAPGNGPVVSWAPSVRTNATSCVANGAFPDRGCTPGALNPKVTQANIQSTICVPGFSKTVRPPVSYTGPLKVQLMRAYGLAGRDPTLYELDHLISLELGGAPRDPANLWPEASGPRPGFHEKDLVENYLHKQVCAGAMQLRQAQHLIATDWVSVYRQIHP